MKIETEIANATTKIIEENNGVYIPPNVEPGTRMHFAIDNTDFHNCGCEDPSLRKKVFQHAVFNKHFCLNY